MAVLEDETPEDPEKKDEKPSLPEKSNTRAMDEAVEKYTFKGPLKKVPVMVSIDKTINYLVAERLAHIELRDAIYLKLWYLSSIFNARLYRSIIIGTRIYNASISPSWFTRAYRFFTGRSKFEPITLILTDQALAMLKDDVFANGMGMVLGASPSDEGWAQCALSPGMLSEEDYRKFVGMIFKDTPSQHINVCYAAYLLINQGNGEALHGLARTCNMGVLRLGASIDTSIKTERLLIERIEEQRKERPGVDITLFKHTLVMNVPESMAKDSPEDIVATVQKNSAGMSDAMISDEISDLDIIHTMQQFEIAATMREYEKGTDPVEAEKVHQRRLKEAAEAERESVTRRRDQPEAPPSDDAA